MATDRRRARRTKTLVARRSPKAGSPPRDTPATPRVRRRQKTARPAAASAGDPDLPGRLGDSGDRHLPGAAAAAAAAAAGAGSRLSGCGVSNADAADKIDRSGSDPGPVFLCAS
jgi:hypothetical protein